MYNLCFTLDTNYLPTLEYVFTSFIMHNNPALYKIHFITYNIENPEATIQNIMKNIHYGFNIKVASVNAEIMGDLLPYLKTYYTQVFNPNKKTVFANLANWARFYIPTLFPELDHCLYLDLDILFTGNIKEIVSNPPETQPIGIIPYSPKKKKLDRSIYNKLHTQLAKVDKSKCKHIDKILKDNKIDIGLLKKTYGFNCGVIYFNLNLWKEQKLHEKMCKLFKNLCKKNDLLFCSGTEMIQNILTPNYESYPQKFNTIVDKDKERNVLPMSNIEGISIIHFKGVKKHWEHPLYLKLHSKIIKKNIL